MTAMELLRIEIITFIAGIAIAVFWKLVTGAITMHGLLRDKITGKFSPVHLQLMLATLMGAGFYVGEFAQTKDGFPEPSVALLTVVGGSNAIHLGNKFWSVIKLARSLRH